MTERVNMIALSIIGICVIVACILAFVGQVTAAKEIVISVVSGLLGLLGGHRIGYAIAATQNAKAEIEKESE